MPREYITDRFSSLFSIELFDNKEVKIVFKSNVQSEEVDEIKNNMKGKEELKGLAFETGEEIKKINSLNYRFCFLTIRQNKKNLQEWKEEVLKFLFIYGMISNDQCAEQVNRILGLNSVGKLKDNKCVCL